MTYIRAELKFKNAALLIAIEETGLSIPEFSKVCGVSYFSICSYINFQQIPGRDNMDKICSYLGLTKEHLFLKYLKQYQLKCTNSVKWYVSEPQFKVLSTASNNKLLTKDFKTDINRVLATLTERQSKIIQLYYLEEKTLEQIGEDLDLTRERVRQILTKGIMRMKHTSRKNLLRDYL